MNSPIKNLRRLSVFLIPALLGLTFFSCARSQTSTLQEVNEAEAQWKIKPVSDYRIVVEVQQQADLRRNEITVQDGNVTRAVVSYWNSDENKWEAGRPLNQEQALPFTVPGLFGTVREQITNSSRKNIRVLMKGNPPIPDSIILGPLFQNGEPVSGSKTVLIVRIFERLRK